MYSVFVLLLLLHCSIFILVLSLCCVSRSSLYCNICSDLCSLCLSCYYFYIVLSLHLYCCYVVYTDHHFTVIYLQTCVLCVCFVITSKLFYLYTCTVVMLCIPDHHFTVIFIQICLLCVCLVILLNCFIFILVLLLCCVYRSSLYCNIPSDLCTLCLSCYYFYIVLSLYLYCCYVVYTDHHFTVIYLQTCVLCVCLVILLPIFILVLLLCLYPDHHFTVIYLQTCVLCVCLVITSTLFYLYTCTVVMLCIQIITLL